MTDDVEGCLRFTQMVYVLRDDMIGQTLGTEPHRCRIGGRERERGTAL